MTRTEIITPQKAQEYLSTSQGNRPISKIFVRTFAEDMKKGRWMLNGVPIIFDEYGHLIDGHHRLEAIVMADIPVAMDIREGVSSSAFATFDIGRHRSTAQMLAIQGVKNCKHVAAVVGASVRLKVSGRLWRNNLSTNWDVSSRNIYELYLQDPEGYNEAASFAAEMYKKCRVLNTSWIGGLYYYLTNTGGYDREMAKAFFRCLSDLGDNSIQPAVTLRNTLAKEAIEGRQLESGTLWIYIVKAWNAYAKGTELKKFRKGAQDDTLKLILNQKTLL